MELNICPASWKTARGKAVEITSRDGYRIPCLRTGTFRRSHGTLVDTYTSNRHQNETNANCTIVNVMGMGRAFKMDFDDVFVTAEVKYQITQSAYERILAHELTSHSIFDTYNQAIGYWRSKSLCQFVRVGAHTAIACSNRCDGFADALPWPVFSVPYGTIGVIARVKGRFPRLP